MKKRIQICFLLLLFLSIQLPAQNEAKKWYFGNMAGLDFMTSPPTILTNGVMNTLEGCASIADASGNLLFYTSGSIIWNQAHQLMANGSGLMGGNSSTQSGVIVKQPGNNNIYYVFTQAPFAQTPGLQYSIVDMNLAAGMGSVTTKNVQLHTPSTEKLTAVRHCNGVDIWIISHDWGSSNFRAHLLTSSGISSSPVITAIGPFHSGIMQVPIGYMKASPDGSRLGLAITGLNASITVEGLYLFDFNNSTGVVSHSLMLRSTDNLYGCEFSPDGSKFYASRWQNPVGKGYVFQWDLCAGPDSLIIASIDTIASTQPFKGALQLGPDGKIYVARVNQNALGVINNPNLAGSACNYVDIGQSIGTQTCNYGLPNFVTSSLVMPQFSMTLSCQNASFTAPSLAVSCASPGSSVTGVQWNFGDPISGPANTSTLMNPTHVYSSGTHTVKLALYRNNSCGSVADTVTQTVTVASAPNLSITGKSSICTGETTTLTASGALTYTWNSNPADPKLVVSPTVNTTYTVMGTSSISCTASRIVTITVSNCAGISLLNDVGSLEVYPNPNKGSLVIENNRPLKVVLCDQMGSKVFESQLQPGQNLLDLRYISNGIYTLKVMDQQGVRLIKLVKAD